MGSELHPGAIGFLGATAGVTDDGRFIVMVRFDRRSARANSERPEQGTWWAETEKCLDRVSFQESTDIVTMLGGGSDDAGFVQVMRGRVTDPAKLAELQGGIAECEAVLRVRPEMLGEIMAIHSDGTYTDAVYFRRSRSPSTRPRRSPPTFRPCSAIMSTIAVDEYLDLADPVLR